MKSLQALMTHGRATWSELAAALGLSPPAVAERIHRMEQQGVITGYSALVDSELVGCPLTAFVAVTLDHPRHRDAFLIRVADLPEVQECHHVAGDHDYLLKVRCRNTRDLDRVVSVELKGLPGIAKTHTTIVLQTAKETPAVPLFAEFFATKRPQSMDERSST